MKSPKEKFISLLKEIFEFDAYDLDFGIYRILNAKRDLIKKFIEKDLTEKIDKVFSKLSESTAIEAKEKLEKARKDLEESLGKEAIKPDGSVVEEYKNLPVAQKYLEAKLEYEKSREIESQKIEVFNDLYRFFSRFYENGDFVPHYRYSIRKHTYAIPYNGEEVKLYWATDGQYYVKTGTLFRNYTFLVEDYKVVFRIIEATQPIGSNKENKKKYFILSGDNPIEFNKESKTLVINFVYAELPGEKNISQDNLNIEISTSVLNMIDDVNLKGYLAKTLPEKNNKTLIQYHLNRFTAKNTRDFFIHKNLRAFLLDQLDYFLKSDVLKVDDLKEPKISQVHLARMLTVKEIAEYIIDFLSEMEDFLKKLWEKKKFVIKTEYVITLDRLQKFVAPQFFEFVINEVLKNEQQLNEWSELGFGDIKEKEDLFEDGNILNTPKKLPIDTRYFNEEFKEKLLTEISKNVNLDEALDGLLIKSENWQALNLILNKYKEKIQTIYIDPPYNTGSDGFLYRDRYQHSSWLTMMENRLSIAKELMKDDGVIFISIDDREQERLKELIKKILDEENFLAQIVRDIPDGSNLRTVGGIKTTTEYVISFFIKKEPSLNPSLPENTLLKKLLNLNLSEKIETRLTKRGNKSQEIEFPAGIGVLDKKVNITKREGEVINIESKEKILIKKGNLIIEDGILKEDVVLEAEWSMPKVLREFFNGKEVFDDSGQRYEKIFFKKTGVPYILKSRSKFLVPNYLNIKNEKDALYIDLLGYNESPKEATIKPVPLIYLLLSLYGNSNSVTLDFFAGSGTTAQAIMELNREDGGKRKFILVEMADYFDIIIIPRLKKVSYSFNWKKGIPQNANGIGIFFKYQILEQYEDTLDNLEIKNSEKSLFDNDESLIKYIFEPENFDSTSIPALETLKKPFDYYLQINFVEAGRPEKTKVDIPETFNYLIGLEVDKLRYERLDGNKYLFVLGKKGNERIAVIWRNWIEKSNEEGYKKDRDFIKSVLKDWKPDRVYVNGDSIITPDFLGYDVKIEYIEPTFKKLMMGD